MVVFWGAVALFVAVVLGAVVKVTTRLNILRFLDYFREESTIVLAAASIATSEGDLAVALAR